MPSYIILRMERHASTMLTPDGVVPAFIVKPQPLALVKGNPLTVEAESPELALAWAVRRYPHFRGILATQDAIEYEQQQHSPDTSRVLGRTEARRARA